MLYSRAFSLRFAILEPKLGEYPALPARAQLDTVGAGDCMATPVGIMPYGALLTTGP